MHDANEQVLRVFRLEPTQGLGEAAELHELVSDISFFLAHTSCSLTTSVRRVIEGEHCQPHGTRVQGVCRRRDWRPPSQACDVNRSLLPPPEDGPNAKSCQMPANKDSFA
jgi:hypothetical protein